MYATLEHPSLVQQHTLNAKRPVDHAKAGQEKKQEAEEVE